MEKSYREWIIRIICLFLGVSAAVLTMIPGQKEKEEQRKIAQNVLRFHIRANSDSEKDQKEKIRVRDLVLDILNEISCEDDTKEQVKEKIRKNSGRIQKVAEEAVFPRSVKISMVWDWFPEKKYGDCTFPTGWYEALRIDIGKAEGHNWWCVLYPGLCYADSIHPVFMEKGKKELKQILDDDAYDFIMHPGKTKIKFRWLKRWNFL